MVKKVFTFKKQPVYEIELKNEDIQVKILTLGATLTHFSKLNEPNTLISYKDIKSYADNNVYLGSTIGPLAGRTKNGKITIDNHEYQLDINNPPNHLHGGNKGIDQHIFNYIYEDDERFPSVVFSDTIDHTDSGYPGKITYYIQYRLVRNTLIVNLKAVPDTKTTINLTTHAYFNLSQEETILNHLLKVDSNQVVELDETYAPSKSLINVHNTAFDFRSAYVIGERIKRKHPQFEMTRSIDHCYLLRDMHSVVLFDPKTKTSLAMNTTAPACVVYLANFFDEQFATEFHPRAKNHAGIAIEPSDVVNGYNLDLAPLYSPDEPFDQTTWYTLN